MEAKFFTIRECGRGPTVCGLERVTIDNANLARLATDRPIESLEVGETTIGRARGQAYEVVRVA